MKTVAESEVRRVIGIVGEGYREGLEPELEVLLPRRIIRTTPGVEDAAHLLANDKSAATFEACADSCTDVVLDFGTEIVGIPELVFGDGTVGEFRVEYGEDLRECLGEIGLPFQRDLVRFTPNAVGSVDKRRAFRFARVKARGTHGTIALKTLRVHSSIKPIPRTGYFTCSEDMLNDIWRVAVRTVHVCMQEYLEDGVKRDCCLWAGDLRPAALTALYAFADADYIAHNIRAFVPWRYREGAIPPMVGHSYVMYDYVAWWTVALHDYYQHTGDESTVRELFTVVADQVKFLEKRRNSRGLIEIRIEYDAPFTDWTCSHRQGEVTFHQALFCKMLRDAATMAEMVGEKSLAEQWRKEAQEVREAVNRHLWSEDLGMYADFCRDGLMSSRTSVDSLALAVLYGVADGDRAAKALDWLKEHHWCEYGSLHLNQAYEEGAPDWVRTCHGNYVPPMINGYEIAAHFSQGRIGDGLELADRVFGTMVRRGATTFWEGMNHNTGQTSQSGGSQCHSWTGMIAYLLQSHVLGIRPGVPGFESCIIDPQMGPLGMVCGVVPTPKGLIAARAERQFAGDERRTTLSISTPDGVSPVAVLHPTGKKTTVRLNGTVIFEDGQWADEHQGGESVDGELRIPLNPGNHELVMACAERNFSFLPKQLSENLYVKGSFKPGKDGFSFKIRGDITNLSVTGIRPIRLDGIEYEDYTLDGRHLSSDNPRMILVGQEAEVRVRSERPIPDGEHVLEFSFHTGWGRPVAMTVEVTV